MERRDVARVLDAHGGADRQTTAAILERFDALGQASDRRPYVSPLDPAPADPRVAHHPCGTRFQGPAALPGVHPLGCGRASRGSLHGNVDYRRELDMRLCDRCYSLARRARQNDP